ncbi:MAG: hypothetical protein JHD15_23685 [Phenylobacterium sp.]|uniref:hypothetical protein n=1 Tax=Phenylobacterium sp. TaxID=1871053 RepID=UPI001A2516C9|nr:hypothetical protein [Phenylobacterium sp.]MBJ7413337.1 hypothetical protein [Phenylobacterium sp.]
MENDDAIMAGEGDLVRAEDLGPDGDLAVGGEPETIEVELDGAVYTVPAALKGAILRQADYTRKTQELAEHRRALEAEREAFGQEASAFRGASRDRIRLAALDDQLAEFEGVDWEAYSAEAPEAAQDLWGRFQAMAEAREQLAYAVAHADERDQLRAARAAAEEMAATGARLREEIDGWSPEVAAKLVEYGQAFGVTLEELAQMADPRLWKLLHKAWRADQAGEAQAGAQALAVRPAVTVSGGGAGGGGLRDELGAKEWMRRRNDQMARGR